MVKESRSFKLQGVKVTVIKKEDSFDLIMNIDAGTDLTQKRNSKQGRITFMSLTAKTTMVSQNSIHLELTNLPYNEPKNIRKNFKKSFTVKQDVLCTVSLPAEFYLPRKTYKASQKATKKVSKGSSYGNIEFISESRSSKSVRYDGRGAIPYKYNNVSKPYQGGKVSPK